LDSADFSVSGFRSRKHRGVTARTDKGKKHSYPAERAAPYTYCKKRRLGIDKEGSGYQLNISYFLKAKSVFNGGF